MDSKRYKWVLVACLVPFPLLAGDREAGSSPDPAQTLERVLASPGYRVTETRIIDCDDRKYPTLIQIGRFTEARSIDQAQRTRDTMHGDASRACMHGERVKLVFLAPAHGAERGLALAQTDTQ